MFKTVKKQSVSVQDLEQFSHWQQNGLMSAHWYNLYNPVISVELTELFDRVVGNNDAVEEIQLDLTVQQHRVSAWNENFVDVYERRFITSTSAIDYKSRVLDGNAVFSLTSSSGIYGTPVNTMFRCAD